MCTSAMLFFYSKERIKIAITQPYLFLVLNMLSGYACMVWTYDEVLLNFDPTHPEVCKLPSFHPYLDLGRVTSPSNISSSPAQHLPNEIETKAPETSIRVGLLNTGIHMK
jgi:hypothetical protein